MKKILASMAITVISAGTFTEVPLPASIASQKQNLSVVKKQIFYLE